ncbi:DNA-binding transcriptional regulator, MerR family [Mesobacillus persicus]|uniref:DNA-binding transcriptional regulator, MerR family n=1 Tax=Mesobacillus persicus TaxID=930146 RepID=A0A1H8CLJ6_9BACI|nr:MerR family transcriptional regulator [Mesobacillus persicus]SEM95900.1 DNA-binding transcriptional regulator, MerR family [Mesobacillus persicus]
MEYTIQSLASLAGVSTRTLRYYDEIGLLPPARINSSGYRIYGQAEVNQLQQILFYRELGVRLDKITELMTAPSFDVGKALEDHREKLIEKRDRLNLLIANVEKSLALTEGRTKMSDKEKFNGFKKKLIEDNEKVYGQEVRGKYGDEAVNQSNAKLLNMSQEDYEKVTKLEQDIRTALAESFLTGDPESELAQKAADLHKQWISYYWPQYSKEAHAGLAQMYVADERFTAYYDKEQVGTAEFLRDAILIYTK